MAALSTKTRDGYGHRVKGGISALRGEKHAATFLLLEHKSAREKNNLPVTDGGKTHLAHFFLFIQAITNDCKPTATATAHFSRDVFTREERFNIKKKNHTSNMHTEFSHYSAKNGSSRESNRNDRPAKLRRLPEWSRFSRGCDRSPRRRGPLGRFWGYARQWKRAITRAYRTA